jgi:hypothetical protein
MGYVEFIPFLDRLGQLVGFHMGSIEIDVQITAQPPFSPKKPWLQPGIATDQLHEALTDRATVDVVPASTLGKMLQERRYIDFNTLQNSAVSLFLAI